ncbi:uncharacterized protein METZ01_LOCUS434461, partial [marine metagenome]
QRRAHDQVDHAALRLRLDHSGHGRAGDGRRRVHVPAQGTGAPEPHGLDEL